MRERERVVNRKFLVPRILTVPNDDVLSKLISVFRSCFFSTHFSPRTSRLALPLPLFPGSAIIWLNCGFRSHSPTVPFQIIPVSPANDKTRCGVRILSSLAAIRSNSCSFIVVQCVCVYPVLLISCPHIPFFPSLLPFLFLRSLDCAHKSLRRRRRPPPSLQVRGAARVPRGCVKSAPRSHGTRCPNGGPLSQCAPSSLARGGAAVEEGGTGRVRAGGRAGGGELSWRAALAASGAGDRASGSVKQLSV